MPSTLHLFCDLFRAVAGARDASGATRRAILLTDAQAYPIARWGAEGVRLDGAACETFPHHDAAALARKARRAFRAGLRPIVVTDGICPSCGRIAPLPELAGAAADHGGHLIVDDTQALGVLGAAAGATMPLGRGGGGTLAWYGLRGPHISAGCSLAKGFGAPLAVLLGAKDLVTQIAREGDSRVHTSPPSAADIAAARAALIANATGAICCGPVSRGASASCARAWPVSAHACSAPCPCRCRRSRCPPRTPARAVLAALDRRSIRALVTKACQGGLSLTVILTANHAAADVSHLIDALAAVLRLDTQGNGRRMAMS